MTDDLNKLFTEYLLDGQDYTNPTQESAGITLADMQAAIERLKPVMWYAVTPWLERGKVYKIPADVDGSRPECHVFNSDDFDEMRGQLAKQFTLRDIQDFKPDYRMITLRRLSRLYPPELVKMFTNVSV